MTILHVTDFHFNQRWFDWLRYRAPAHDLLVMSGDLLDQASPISSQKQMAWVSAWLAEYPGAVCVCSGNHDLEWDAQLERWQPAYWLRDIDNPQLWTDGQTARFGEASIAVMGCATRPKGRPADLWVAHAPPAATAVARRHNGYDGGDVDLIAPVKIHRPRIVFSGHVHDPVRWHEQAGATLLLNPGRDEHAPFPNHILVDTGTFACEHVSSVLGSRRVEINSAGEVPAVIAAA